jgi:16S rRNA (uracil1498-N3)-methyltransferase
MRRPRIYTTQALIPGSTAVLDGKAGHYLVRVLRLAVTDPVTLFNGDGRDYAGEICTIERDRVSVRIREASAPGNESPLHITLVQAVSRGERMDYTLQKATELGVACIQPVTSQRVEVHLDQKKQAKRLVHWQGVVISACEQSGRAVVPEVKPLLSLQQWLQSRDETPCLVLDPLATASLSQVPIDPPSVALLIGPEGGFSEAEMEQLRATGLSAVSLGPRVLRTETAGPAAIAVLQAISGDI